LNKQIEIENADNVEIKLSVPLLNNNNNFKITLAAKYGFALFIVRITMSAK